MKRQIEFTIGDDMKITPTAVQEGGVQGEHNAAQVIFHLRGPTPAGCCCCGFRPWRRMRTER